MAGRSTRSLAVMPQGPILTFESVAFPVAKGEDEETNPGIFGRSLAEWLSKQLKQRGVPTTGVIAEDFGWCVAVASDADKLYVACSSANDSETSWQVFAFSDSGLFKRFLGKNKSSEALGELHRTVKQILGENPAVRALQEDHDS